MQVVERPRYNVGDMPLYNGKYFTVQKVQLRDNFTWWYELKNGTDKFWIEAIKVD
jgi:GW (Gly-Tryp) dipeptide domain